MPFGKYGAKTVQAMSGLFNSAGANRLSHRAGMIGRGPSTLEDLEGVISSGRRRIGVGGAVLGGAIISSDRSSGSRGLSPRSSAPPPGMPF